MKSRLATDCAADCTRDYTARSFGRVRRRRDYSKGDGVVRWEWRVVRYAENVEVRQPRRGLVFNRKAYRAIAPRSANPELRRRARSHPGV